MTTTVYGLYNDAQPLGVYPSASHNADANALEQFCVQMGELFPAGCFAAADFNGAIVAGALSIDISAGTGFCGASDARKVVQITVTTQVTGLAASNTNYLYLNRAGTYTANITGVAPDNAILVCTCATSGSEVTSVNNLPTGRVNVGSVLTTLRAASGYLSKSVAGSANVTLTASEYENAVIEFTGILTGSINVILPVLSGRQWVCINTTTGSSFTVTVKTAAGSGALVTRNTAGLVYCDGTNIDLLSALSDMALVTGTLAIANGGTGSTTAAAARTALDAQEDVITTTGDLVIGAVNVAARLGIGTNGQVLTSNGTTAAWAAGGGVTGGDAHDHVGGDGAQVDHGGLGGLADDDHTQYVRHTLAVAESDFLVGAPTPFGTWIKKTLAEVKTILGLGTAAYTAATDYVTHALATAANDFLVASGAGTYVKKTLAETLTILGKGAASGLATLSAGTLVVENPANATVTATASKIPIADGSAKLDTWISASSTTVSGLTEAATAAEVTTGTDAARAVTPDALAGSDYGKREIAVQVIDGATVLTVGDGKAYVRIPASLNGYNLVAVAASVIAKSTSGLPTVQIARGRQANATTAHAFVDTLSTLITIDANEFDSKDATTAAAINAANDDLATGDLLRIDVDVAGTGTTGLMVNLTTQLP